MRVFALLLKMTVPNDCLYIAMMDVASYDAFETENRLPRLIDQNRLIPYWQEESVVALPCSSFVAVGC
jgi:hypothetical protein